MIKIKYKFLMPIMAALTSIYITACGGAGTIIADGGISGTGITMGRITNFGSIFVNGVRFDVNSANFVRDGVVSSGQTEFSVGEYVVIKGTVDSAGISGTAVEVSFTDILEGAVTLASFDNSTIEILGQTVTTDQLTVFIGFNLLGDLMAGNMVEVSGVKDAAGIIRATSIKLKELSFVVGESENELKGSISSLNTTTKTFAINTITVDYANAVLDGFNGSAPQDGQFVEVKSDSMTVGYVLLATKVELEDEYQSLEEGTDAKIEGQVTRFVSPLDFDVNGLGVTSNNETEFENGTVDNITLGIFLEVEGKVGTNGVLIAESISLKENESASELEGDLSSIDLVLNQIIVSGQVIVVNASTIMIDESDLKVSPLTLADLVIGDRIEVKGSFLENGNLLASKLERENGQDIEEDATEEEVENGEE